jgi:Asp-tRNA(Asn)/Glu-tRNA(Gln) amidotransferase A subunit family amidase
MRRGRDARAPDAPFGDFANLPMSAVYGSRVKKGVYDVAAMHGLPVGVQVVGSAWTEEKTLAIMRVLDNALGPRGFGPGEFTKRKW